MLAIYVASGGNFLLPEDLTLVGLVVGISMGAGAEVNTTSGLAAQMPFFKTAASTVSDLVCSVTNLKFPLRAGSRVYCHSCDATLFFE